MSESFAKWRALSPGGIISRILIGLFLFLYGIPVLIPNFTVSTGALQIVALIAGVAVLVGL